MLSMLTLPFQVKNPRRYPADFVVQGLDTLFQELSVDGKPQALAVAFDLHPVGAPHFERGFRRQPLVALVGGLDARTLGSPLPEEEPHAVGRAIAVEEHVEVVVGAAVAGDVELHPQVAHELFGGPAEGDPRGAPDQPPGFDLPVARRNEAGIASGSFDGPGLEMDGRCG
jgi:hypothetical protein